MKKNFVYKSLACVAIVGLVTGCGSVRLVSSYDEILDKGVTEFATELNTDIKDMASEGGADAGTYSANIKTYNELDSKLEVLISRAESASPGAACKLESKVYDKVAEILQANVPAGVIAGQSATSGDPNACNAELLILVREQLQLIETIHQKTDKCGPVDNISCIRMATAKTALEIANESINAVSVVERAEKQ